MASAIWKSRLRCRQYNTNLLMIIIDSLRRRSSCSLGNSSFSDVECVFSTVECVFSTVEHRFSSIERRFLLMVPTNSPYSFNNFFLYFEYLLLILSSVFHRPGRNFSLFYCYFSLIIFGIVVNNVYFCSYEQITNRFI